MVERTEHDYSNSEIEPHRTGEDEIALEKQSTAASGYSAFDQRTQSIVSRIRSREPGQTAKFHHPLTHTKTSPDVIVDFDGPDDPYRPLNWGFKKKAITTVLYGLTTMGMSVRGKWWIVKNNANYQLQGRRGRVRCMSISFCFCCTVYALLN